MEDDSLLESFIEESNEHLETIEEDLLVIEQSSEEKPEIINRLFRAMHTIKGNAGFLEFENIRNLAHALEDFLSCVRNGEITITASHMDNLLKGVDQLRVMIQDIQHQSEYSIEDLVVRIRAMIDSTQEDVVHIKTPQQIIPIELKEVEKKEPSQNMWTLSFQMGEWEERNHKSPVHLIRMALHLGLVLAYESQLEFKTDNDIALIQCQIVYSTHLSQKEIQIQLGLEPYEIHSAEIVYTTEIAELSQLKDSHSMNFNSMLNQAKGINQGDLGTLVSLMETMEPQLNSSELPQAASVVLNRLYSLTKNILFDETSFILGKAKLVKGLEKLQHLNENEARENQVASSTTVSIDISDETMNEFQQNALSSLQTMEAYVLEYEKGNPIAIEELKGRLHTLKGELGFVRLEKESQFIHQLEEYVNHKPDTQVLLEALDYCIEQFQQLSQPQRHEFKSFESFLLQGTSNQKAVEEIPQEKIKVPDPSVKDLVQKKVAEETLRVGVGRLDKLIDAIGEAVIAHGIATGDKVVSDIKSEVTISDRAQLKQKLERLEVIMRQIQEYSMSLRMINLKGTFQKMGRMVRDLSRQLDKQVKVIMEGEETELDKSIVEHLADPLIHLIRNSMDHGIETPQEREAAHKDPEGTIKIKSYHKSGNVVIEVQDDGKGINPKKILAKAIERGVVNENQSLDENEVLQLIFHPGLSTVENVTQLSGRGVGMDVVKRNIESLRGAVEIQSVVGEGTTLTIKLPLTLAIINGMVIRVEAETYIIPTLSVIETLSIKPHQIEYLQGKGQMIQLRDEIVRVYDLGGLLEVPDLSQGIEKIGLIVEDAMGRKCAILVDQIVDQQQVVIKKLSEDMSEIQALSGGAIMSNGQVSLILDVGGLLKMAFEQKESELWKKVS